MKKLITVFLCIILMLSALPVAYAASTGRYIVTASKTDVYFSPSFSAEKLSELTKNTFVDVIQLKDGFGRAYIAKDEIWGWVPLENMEFVSESVSTTDITGIIIKTLPTKLTYTDSRETLDLTGLSVFSVNKNGVQKQITSFSVYAPEMKLAGDVSEKKTVTVTYSPDGISSFTANFNVTVVRQAVTKISVVNPPKSTYLENQPLDLTALSLKLTFSDGSSDETYSYEDIKNNSDFKITGCHSETQGTLLSHGTHTFTVTYKYTDINCKFSVNVTPRNLTSLEIISLPENLTVYDNTKVPALDGLVLSAAYDNGDIEEVYHYNCSTDFDPSSLVIGSGNKVNVYFGGLFVTVEFTYSIALPQKILLEYPEGFSLTFLKGEIIDLSPIKVRLVYTDDTYEYVKDFTISRPDYGAIDSTQNIVVRYNEFSEVFSIIISSAFSKGDINGDGKVLANDARQALRASVALTTLAGKTFFAGDADRNGKITAADARLILRASVGLENLYVVPLGENSK